MFSVLVVTLFLHHFRIWLYWILSDYTILLKLLDGIIQRFGSYMNISIHGCFYAGVSQKGLQYFRGHTAFDCTGCVCVPQSMHTYPLDTGFIAKFVEGWVS